MKNENKYSLDGDTKILLKSARDIHMLNHYHDDINEIVRMYIAMNENITTDLLDLMYEKESCDEVINEILKNKKVSEKVLLSEYKKRNFKTIHNVLSNRNLPIYIFKEILDSNDYILIPLIATNPILPNEIFDLLLSKDDDINIKSSLIFNKKLSDEKRLDYYKSNNTYLKKTVCKSENLSTDLLNQIIYEDITDVLLVLLNNPNLNDYSTFKSLSKNKSELVRDLVSIHPNTPVDILKEMVLNVSEKKRIRKNRNSTLFLFHGEKEIDFENINK